jgi:hypothetical protein
VPAASVGQRSRIFCPLQLTAATVSRTSVPGAAPDRTASELTIGPVAPLPTTLAFQPPLRVFSAASTQRTACPARIPIDEGVSAAADQISEVVSGHSPGVDSLGVRWAEEHGIARRQFRPQWRIYRRAAGMARNRQMAEYGDRALVVWNGASPGSKHMIEQMKRLGKPVFVFTVQ